MLRKRGYVFEKDEEKTPAQFFMDEVLANSQSNPIDDTTIIFDNVVLLEIKRYGKGFEQHKDTVRLSAIITLYPNEGRASKAMKHLQEIGRKHGVSLEGTVKRMGTQGLNNKQLLDWYKRLGFKVSRGTEVRWSPS